MSSPARVLEESRLVFEQTGAWLRLLLVAFGTLVYLLLLDRADLHLPLADVLLATAIAYSVWVVVAEPYRRYPELTASWLVTVVDSVLTGLWLYATGGVDSPFFVAMYLAVTSIAFRMSMREAFYAAGIYGAGYVALALVTDELAAHVPDVTVRVGYLFLTAALAGTFARLLVTAGAELAARQQAEERRDRFIEGVISAQDDERRRIARELHDETGQALASLVVGLTALREESKDATTRQRADRLRAVAERTIDEVGRLARGLHPSALDDLGFAAAIGRHAADFARAHGIQVDVHVRGIDAPGSLSLTLSTALYRIVQEALTNVAKHAGARNVCVIVDRGAESVRAVIEDDGRGFDPERASDGRLGLHGIRERVALLEGSLDIDSTPGQGTTVAVTLPLGTAA